jgi:hypothetical protein
LPTSVTNPYQYQPIGVTLTENLPKEMGVKEIGQKLYKNTEEATIFMCFCLGYSSSLQIFG